MDRLIENRTNTKSKQAQLIDIDSGDQSSNPDRKYVYFDLGANNGDSLANFFGFDEKVFLGWKLNNDRINSVNWIVYAFEANPIFNEQLSEMKRRIPSQNSVHMYNGTAAWIQNGEIDFYLDLVNSDNEFWGSSLKKTHPDVIKSGKVKKPLKHSDS